MRVSPCSGVPWLLLYVSLCVSMLRRVPLHIRVSPETRQRLRTQRHLIPDSAVLIREIGGGRERPFPGRRCATGEFDPAPTDANELAAPIKAAPLEPIPGCTRARLMLNEVGPDAQHFIANRSCHGPKALHRDPIRLYVLASNPR